MTYDKHRFCPLVRGEGGANQGAIGRRFVGDGVFQLHVVAGGRHVQRDLVNAVRRGVRDHRVATAVRFDALMVKHGDIAGSRGFYQNVGISERLAQRQAIFMHYRTAADAVAEVAGVAGVAVAQVVVSPRAFVLQGGIAAVVLLGAVALVDAIEQVFLARQVAAHARAGGCAGGVCMGRGKARAGRQRRVAQRDRNRHRQDVIFLVVIQARASLDADAKRHVAKRGVPRKLQALRGI